MRPKSLAFQAGISLVPAVLLAGATVALTAPVAVAQETIQCRSSATVFNVNSAGDLRLFKHTEPETGLFAWENDIGQGVGNGWLDEKPIAGPDGRLYSADAGGELRRLRWTGTTWEKAPDGKDYYVIDNGWARYATPEWFNQVTVDEAGHFYNIEPDGNLHFRSFDEQAKTWTHKIIDTGWSQYNLIVAAGRGVIYARKSNGVLHRYRYHADSQRWLMYQKQVGTGWDGFKNVSSPGGDVLYGGVTSNGHLLWYRYLEATDTWVSSGSQVGKLIGYGWNTLHAVTANSDSCAMVTNPFPQRPAVALQENGASHVTEGPEGKLQHFYVDAFGRLVHGRQRNTSDISLLDFSVVPGDQHFAEGPSAARTSDNTMHVTALGQDSETRTNTLTAPSTTWSAQATLGGWTPGPASIAVHNNALVLFAVDSAGKLWSRKQDPVSKTILPWQPLPSSGLTRHFTVVPNGTGLDILALNTSGFYTKAKYTAGALSAWSTTATGGWTKKPSAVVLPGGKLQIFAAQADGTIAMLTETTAGLNGTWQTLPGLTATGAPAATMTGAGLIQVTARAADGYINFTEQVALGSPTYRPWQRITDSATGAVYPAATDPATMTHSTGFAVVTYRDQDGITYSFKTITPAAAARTDGQHMPPTQFTGGPAPKPAL